MILMNEKIVKIAKNFIEIAGTDSILAILW
jgi:hypothetical protein